MNLAVGTVKYVKPILKMYEWNISELNEDKFFSFIWWMVLDEAKGKKSHSELRNKNVP